MLVCVGVIKGRSLALCVPDRRCVLGRNTSCRVSALVNQTCNGTDLRRSLILTGNLNGRGRCEGNRDEILIGRSDGLASNRRYAVIRLAVDHERRDVDVLPFT
jgi:hypothetical protein